MLNFTFFVKIFKNEIIDYFDAPRRDESIGNKISKIGWLRAKLCQSKLWHEKIFFDAIRTLDGYIFISSEPNFYYLVPKNYLECRE